MGENWAPDMMGGSDLFWVMATVIIGQAVMLLRLRAHGCRDRGFRRRAAAADGGGLRQGERPVPVQIGGGRPRRRGKLAVLAGMVAVAAAIGFEMRHHPAAPAVTAPAARPNVTIINKIPAPVINKVPAPVVRVFHFPLSGVEIVLIVAVVAVMAAGVLIVRARARAAD